MRAARLLDRVWPTVVFAIVVGLVVGGVSASTPGAWLGALFTLLFFTILSWRFFVPSISLAPVPFGLIAGAGAVAVLVRGAWVGFGVVEGLHETRSWWGLVLLVVAATAAVVQPFTGVREKTVTAMHFPLADGRWRVVEGNGRILNHHWPAPRQRGALDLVRASRLGRARRGLFGTANEKYLAFGARVVSPCEGTVIRAFDEVPDDGDTPNRPAGNNVIIDTGHEHVLLAHLRRGSVSVGVGDRVSTGDEIGEVGNSGNSTEPHLHIHAERDAQPLRLRLVGTRGMPVKGGVLRRR